MLQMKPPPSPFKRILKLSLFLPILLLIFSSLVRVIRHFHKFPIPPFLADLIDNPLRRRFMPPDLTAIRQGVRSGMTVMEVGPGNGRYTVAAAQRVGDGGKIVAVDIEPKMAARVSLRARQSGVKNLHAMVADVYQLPFCDAVFDLVSMTTVIGEIPQPHKACQEFRRVLKPEGKLVFSEILTDPDYPLPRTLVNLAAAAGFRLARRVGNFFYYTLFFEPQAPSSLPPLSRVARTHQAARTRYNRMSSWYDLLTGATEWKLVRKGLEKLALKRGEQVLEIGSGTGRGLVFMANAVGEAGQVYGIDLSEAMLNKARRRLMENGLSSRVELQQGDALRLPFADNSLDAVFVSFTLELFETPELPLFVQEVRRVLKDDGRLGLVCMAQQEVPTLTARMYDWLHSRLPEIADCRPINGSTVLESQSFAIQSNEQLSIWGLPVDILVAKPCTR